MNSELITKIQKAYEAVYYGETIHALDLLIEIKNEVMDLEEANNG